MPNREGLWQEPPLLAGARSPFRYSKCISFAKI